MGSKLDLDDVAATSELAMQELAELRAEIARLRAELDAARVDACRYRWVRDGGWMLIGEDRGNGPEWPEAEDVDLQVDAAIDAARGGE